MLTDKFVDNTVKPFIDRQQQMNNLTVEVISKRLGELKLLTRADLNNLVIINKDMDNINYITNELNKLSTMQMDEIRIITKKTAKAEYKTKQVYYEYAGVDYPRYEDNEPINLLEYMIALYAISALEGYFKDMAYEIRDTVNPLIVKHLSPVDTYNTVINMAKQNIYNGQDVFSHNVNKAFTDLTNNGAQSLATFDDGSKEYWHLDKLTGALVYDAVTEVSNQLNKETGKQFNSDGVELSVHAFPAPDHAPIQGHTFTNEEYEKLQNNEDFEDVLGNKFEGLERVIGQWHCRHFEMSVLLDVFTPNFTPEELQAILDRNEEGYTYTDDKGQHHLTMYECTQKRNRYEGNIKKYRIALQNARFTGSEALINGYTIRLNNAINLYRGFCNNCGLATRWNKTIV